MAEWDREKDEELVPQRWFYLLPPINIYKIFSLGEKIVLWWVKDKTLCGVCLKINYGVDEMDFAHKLRNKSTLKAIATPLNWVKVTFPRKDIAYVGENVAWFGHFVLSLYTITTPLHNLLSSPKFPPI